MKVVINAKYGGFGLSDKVFEALIEKGWSVTSCDENGDRQNPKADIVDFTLCKHNFGNRYGFVDFRKSNNTFRTNPHIIEIIEKLGTEANGQYAKLKVIEIPDGIEWTIEEYDGWEHVSENHRKWD